jgi:hypothetical protein
MKIVNRETFLNMPPNTVFAKYKPCFFDELCIKGETWHEDFWSQSLINIESDNSGEFIDILENARINGNSFRLDLDCEDRDALFEKDQLFAIFEKQDIVVLIERLKECLWDTEEKSYNAIVNETSRDTGYSATKIMRFDDELDNILHNISCPKCRFNATSHYWRKLFNYPRGKIVPYNRKHIICSNCNFEYVVLINLDIDTIKEN